MEKDLKSLPVTGVQQKRGQSIDRLVHACFEADDEEFVFAVQNAQLAVCSGFDVDVISGFQRVDRGVGFAVFSVSVFAFDRSELVPVSCWICGYARWLKVGCFWHRFWHRAAGQIG